MEARRIWAANARSENEKALQFRQFASVFQSSSGEARGVQSGVPGVRGEDGQRGEAAFVPHRRDYGVPGNLFYEFTVNGDEVFCREGYADAEGLLAHLENVGVVPAEKLRNLQRVKRAS
jgi:hypothetical protein